MNSELAQSIAEARKLSRRQKPSRAWQGLILSRVRGPDGSLIYDNNVYTVIVRRGLQGWPWGGGPWAMLGIYCQDGEARHDWRDMQQIKNELCGPMWEAVELFPSEDRLTDPSNYYMLWCAPAIPLGRFGPRVMRSAEDCIAPQRPFPREQTPISVGTPDSGSIPLLQHFTPTER